MKTNQTVDQAPDLRQSRRAARHSARYILWDESMDRRLKNCGRRTVARKGHSASHVTVKASGSGADRRAGFSGLETCGSVWSCPVCSARIAAVRQAEITAAVKVHQQMGGRVIMATYTNRHRAGQSLKSLWDAVSYAWSKVTSGRDFKEAREAGVIDGFVRVVEVTEGDNGWHVHVHALWFISPSIVLMGDDFAASVSSSFLDRSWIRWVEAFKRKGFAAPLRDSGGFDVKHVSGANSAEVLGDYFTKNVYSPAEQVAMEAAGSAFKVARSSNRTPFQVLADIAVNGDAEDLAIWHEWERVSKGKRQLTWSQGLRDSLLATPELTDEEIAEQDAGGTPILRIPRKSFFNRRAHSAILAAAEADETGDTLRALLDAFGIAYEPPEADD